MKRGKFINKLFYIYLIIFHINIVFCQNINIPKEIKSPNASSIGRYGEIPISYYTGRAEVKIPIFETEENGIPLNIDLNYDTGGVRVNDFPSWIGQNWNLNAGGIITRTPKGSQIDEEDRIYGFTGSNDIRGFYYKNSLLNSRDWASAYNMFHYAVDYVPPRDLEPDIFNFNFMGISGKFFLGQDGEWKVQSTANIKVEINMAENQRPLNKDIFFQNRFYDAYTGPERKTIYKITLIDESGNKYIFGNNHNAIEYSTGNFFYYRSGIVVAPNAWFLTEVISYLGKQVYKLEYERAEYQASFYLTFNSTTRNKSNNGGFFTPGGGCIYTEGTPLLTTGVLQMPCYLKKITTNNGYEINFNRSVSNNRYYNPYTERMLDYSLETNYFPNNMQVTYADLYTRFGIIYYDNNLNLLPQPNIDWKQDLFSNKIKNYQLDNIVININSNLYKTVNLNHNNNQPNDRLNLMSVDLLKLNSTVPDKFSFYYNNFNQLPNYLSLAIDHWGFYKGGNGFNTSNTSNHYAEREPDLNFLKIGSLRTIIYPTKGSTTFEYEAHNYSQYVNENLNLVNESNIAGGLRIKKISTYDGASWKIKDLQYITTFGGSNSSGILSLKNKYFWPTWDVMTTDNSLYRETSFSINSLVQNSNFCGSHIAYSKVFEIEGENSGYKVFEYNDYSDYPDTMYTNTLSSQQSQFNAHCLKDFKRGLEKKISFYNNQNVLLKTINNVYSSLNNKSARGFDFKSYVPCPWVGDAVVIGNAYEIEYSDFKIVSKVITDYFANNSITATTNYTNVQYPADSSFFGNTFLKSEEKITSISDNSLFNSNLTSCNYPFDYVSTIDTQMLNKHFMPVKETILSKSGKILMKSKDIYTNQTLNSISNPVLTSTQKWKESGSYENDIIIDKYDNNGNILQYHKSDGINVSFIWNNNLLLYKIENATWNEFTLTTDFTLFNSNSEKNVTKYTYDALKNIQTINYPNGLIEKFFYDTENRIETIKDKNDYVIKTFKYNIR